MEPIDAATWLEQMGYVEESSKPTPTAETREPREFSEEYKEYIHSEEWRQKAKQRKEIDGHICRGCGRSEEALKEVGNHLEVHHLPQAYEHLGNEPLELLTTFCRDCHLAVHKVIRSYRVRPRGNLSNGRRNSRRRNR